MKNPLIALAAFAVALICAGVPLAQQKSATPPTAPATTTPISPAIDTAVRVSIAALETKKQESFKAWSDANQQELLIEREWGAAHPGWHIDNDAIQNGTLQIAPDPKPSTPAPAPAKK
jgi:hypothetical protein